MDKYDIEEALIRIQRCADDNNDEVAHELEKLLWQNVLEEIANIPGSEVDAANLAEQALESMKIKFNRWCVI